MSAQYIKKALSVTRWLKKSYAYRNNKKESNNEAARVKILLNKWRQGKNIDVVKYRNHKLSKILKYAYRHSPYYKKLFQQFKLDPKSLKNFEKLPLLDKNTVRKQRDDIVSDEIERLFFYKANTGGSTGEPLDFPVSYIVGNIVSVHQEFQYRVNMGYNAGDRIVAFDGTSVPEEFLKNKIYWVETSRNDIPFGRLSYSSLYLTSETIPCYINHMLDFEPAILRGYPSFINSICEYILKKGIEISFKVKGVELTAENTYDWQIENIKKALHARVFFQYGHSEASVHAFTTDDTYKYICSPFFGYVEILDSKGDPVKENEMGEIVVTGFYNFAHPFIRYRTGDMAIFGTDEKGFVVLNKIVGRTQDFIYTKDRERIALTALIFGQHYRAFRNIEKWQLVQDVPGKILIKIIRGKDFSSNDEEEIRAKFKNICSIDPDFEFVNHIPLTRAGKFKFLIQHIADN